LSVEETVRSALTQYGGLAADASTIAVTDDLYRLGLTSHASVNLMLALEDEFGIEFTDTMLRRSTFESIATLQAALAELGVTTDATTAG